MPLPSIGTLSYNGVVFDSAAKVRVSCEYEKDSTGRTTTNLIIKLTVEALLAPSDDESVDSLRSKLGEQGKTLIYTGNSFPININNPYDGNSVADVAFGPSPRELAWRPLGGGVSGTIIWQVVATIPACGGEPDGFSLREFVYSVSFDINERGATTRTISGHYKIPLSRFDRASGLIGTGTRDVVTTADTYRDEILSRFIGFKGYTRRSNFTLSEDKATLAFTIVDAQIESVNAWPAHVTNIQVRHRIAWQIRSGGKAINQLAGQITLKEGYGAGWALSVWKSVVDARLTRLLGSDSERRVFVESMQADEDLYGITHSFAMSYWIAGNPGAQGADMVLTGERFLELSGFGLPMQDGGNWSPWDVSRLDHGTVRGPHGLRGTGGQGWYEDRITDQCDGAPLTPLTPPPTYPTPGTSRRKSSVFKAKCPKPDESWLEYKHAWEVMHVKRDLTTVKQLAKTELPKASLDSLGKDLPLLDENTPRSQGTGSNDDVLRRNLRNGNGELWICRGYARRACYPIPKFPDAIKLRDQKATLTLIDQRIARDIANNPFGLKMHTATFAAIYVANKTLTTPPDNVSYP
jgi:hypothetical protein